MEWIRSIAEHLGLFPSPELPDPEDLPFLEVRLPAGSYLVHGMARHYPTLTAWRHGPDPREFLNSPPFPLSSPRIPSVTDYIIQRNRLAPGMLCLLFS